MPITVSKSECTYILQWYEFAAVDSFHYGGAALFPSEQLILNKCRECTDMGVIMTDSQCELINDWMIKTISGRYGSVEYLTAGEKPLYRKIRRITEANQRYPDRLDSPKRKPDLMEPRELLRQQTLENRKKIIAAGLNLLRFAGIGVIIIAAGWLIAYTGQL